MAKIFTAILVCFSLALSASALDLKKALKEARTKGTVQETTSGYLKATDPSAKNLVEKVNLKRKDAYIVLAKEKNFPLKQVEEQAGAKLIQKYGAAAKK